MSETKTKWDSIVSAEALSKAKTLRSKAFVEARERRVALPELIEEGWEMWCVPLSEGRSLRMSSE